MFHSIGISHQIEYGFVQFKAFSRPHVGHVAQANRIALTDCTLVPEALEITERYDSDPMHRIVSSRRVARCKRPACRAEPGNIAGTDGPRIVN